MVFMAVFHILLARHCGRSDLLWRSLGRPALAGNREHRRLLRQPAVVRARPTAQLGFLDFLQRVRAAILDGEANEVPFEKLVEALRPQRDASALPVVQVALVMQSAAGQRFELSGMRLTDVRSKAATSKFDLSLQILDKGEEGEAWFEYATDLFEEATIARMGGHYVRLLEQVLENPQARLKDLSVLTEAEKRQLQSWNATAMPWVWQGGVHELIGERARCQGADVAVLYEQERLSYRELDTRANQLAHYLRDRGVGPEEVVGLCMERSLEMVIGMLGILKAGGAYLPLDPEYPLERLSYMRRDAGARVLLTQSRTSRCMKRRSWRGAR